MMSERQRKFREKYLAEMSPNYSGLLHVLVMFAVGIGALWYCAAHLHDVGMEWLIVIPVFLAGNLIEWAMHRYVMHRRIDVFALRAIYERHTRQHHQYFTDSEPTIHSVREFRIVFFPWRVLAVLAVSGTLFGWIAAQLINANAGYFVFMTMIAHYLVYEVMHLCCHVPENSFVRRMPFVNTIRRHHIAHHNLGIMMKLNMNLTFPIADWLMNSSDLRRGLLGHLFNGYSNAHVKEELRPMIERFRVDHSRVTLDGPELNDAENRVLAQAS